MIWTLLTFALGSVFLHQFFKVLWRAYIVWAARDPESPSSTLPLPPGDFGLPIIGETHLWAVQGSRFNSIRREKYGRIFSTNFIGRTMVKVTGPEFVKQVLTAPHDTIATIWPTTVRKILGEAAIANSVGSIHKFRRKAFLKAFTREALTSYMPQIQECVREKMNSWYSDTSNTYLVYPETKKLTFDVAFRLLLGLSFKDDNERTQLFKTFDAMITNLFSLPYNIPGGGFRKAMKAKNVIHGILDDHIKNIRSKVEESMTCSDFKHRGNNNNVLQIVLRSQIERRRSRKFSSEENRWSSDGSTAADEDENLPEMSDQELKETIVEMLFAGYQTTASVSTSAILNLIQHPRVYRKLEEEMIEVNLLPGCQNEMQPENEDENIADSEDQKQLPLRSRRSNLDKLNNNDTSDEKLQPGEVTMDKLSKMPYLEQFFKETLRIMPPILGGYRVAQKTFEIGGYRVPKGWTIIYNIRDTHESEWKEDMDFKPERFSPSNWKDSKESRYRWIPFGGGPRTCVGKEFARIQFKIFIIEFIRHFKNINFAKGKPPRMFAVPFLHPTDGLPVTLTPRPAN